MAKRFGRQQKRRLKAEAEQWEQAYQMERALLAHVSQRAARAESAIERARYMLGEYWNGLPVQIMKRKGNMTATEAAELQHGMHLLRRQPMVNYSVSFDPEGGITGAFEQQLNDFETVFAVLPSCCHDFPRGYHVELQWDDRRVAYLLSEQAFLNTPAEYLARDISGNMTRHLVESIKSQQRPRAFHG